MDKRENTAASPGETYNMVWELEHLTCKDRLKGSSLFIVEKRWLRVDLTAVFNYLKGSYREDRSIFLKCTAKGQEATDTSCSKRNSIDRRKVSPQCRW